MLAGFLVRVAGADAYWKWFDREFPQTWQVSKLDLSQNGMQYVLQADPGTWNSPHFRGWDDRPYFRPPLASYYFVGLFRLFHFSRLAVSAVQALLATLAYLFAYLTAVRFLGRRVGLLALVLLILHPVLMFEDTSFEDSVLGTIRETTCSGLTVSASSQLGFTSDNSADTRRPVCSAKAETIVGSPKMVPSLGSIEPPMPCRAASSRRKLDTCAWSTCGQNEYWRWSM